MNTTQKKIALVADDYTGAGDSAIHFVKNGFPVELLVAESGCDFTAAVVAVNSETRFLEPADAARAVERIFQRCCRSGCAGFFKKTDSALRGNPGSETEAALNATGLRAALVCSAIPAMRRTCVGGVMYLNGLPLHLSEIGSDQFTPLASSDVGGILASQTRLPQARLGLDELRRGNGDAGRKVERLMSDGAKLIVADAETDADLDVLARLAVDMPGLLPAGSSGLSKKIAEYMGKKVSARHGTCSFPQGPLLAVVGSLTRVARRQAEQALASGRFGGLVLDVDAAMPDPEREISRLAALPQAGAGGNLVVTTATSAGLDKDSGLRVAGWLGRLVSRLLRDRRYGVLYATGGSTAVALLQALGVGRVTLEDELLPGVVRGGMTVDGKPLGFISKAGGFGDDDTLVRLLDFMVV